MTDKGPMDRALWKKKAMAFVTRAHRHLWGKNNEDPLAFLFCQGLSHQFIKQMHLGWNKHGQERTLEKWGLRGLKPPGQDGHFILPPGIVFPYIVDKALLSILIQPLDPESPCTLVPGSTREPILLGNPHHPLVRVDTLLEGLGLFQEKSNTMSIKFQPWTGSV